MQIKWGNVLTVLLLMVLLALALQHRHLLPLAVKNLGGLGPGHSVQEQTLGLLSLGVLGVVFVAVVRLLTQRRP